MSIIHHETVGLFKDGKETCKVSLPVPFPEICVPVIKFGGLLQVFGSMLPGCFISRENVYELKDTVVVLGTCYAYYRKKEAT